MMLKHKKMVHILIFIGLGYINMLYDRSNLLIKMAHKSLINGLVLINMLGIGKIIRKMVLEYNTMKMVTNIKVVG